MLCLTENKGNGSKVKMGLLGRKNYPFLVWRSAFQTCYSYIWLEEMSLVHVIGVTFSFCICWCLLHILPFHTEQILLLRKEMKWWSRFSSSERQMSCSGLFWPCSCSDELFPLGDTVTPSEGRNARTFAFFLVCVFQHFPSSVLSAGLCHCANSWSGLPELIIAFPWCTMPFGTVVALQNWHCEMEATSHSNS